MVQTFLLIVSCPHGKANHKYIYRVSQLAGAKLQDSNPGITNLSDDNRPTKVGEKFAELYDNEWTEAFEEHEETAGDEKATIEYIYKLLLVSKIIKYEPRCEKTGLRVFPNRSDTNRAAQP